MKNQAKVKVTAKEGQVVIANTNPEKKDSGYIRVESETISMEGGFANISKRSALIRGKVEVLKKLGLKEGDPINGKIFLKESTTPSFNGQEPKINPETKAVITHNGMPVYRESFFTAELDKADELLASDTAETTQMVSVESEASKAL